VGPGRVGERWCLAALCLLAAARVWFGAAALPFFADNDENLHYDLVRKFARGHWPDEPKAFLELATVMAIIYDSSPEFLHEPEDTGPFPLFEKPVRAWPKNRATEAFVRQRHQVVKLELNQEAYEPPAYYAVAAAWYRCGAALGLTEPRVIYWVRFLNVPLYAALVAAAYALCRPYLGRDVALATAALTAFFPNTVYFTISNDVLSPLAGALALLLLMRWCGRERPGRILSAAAGGLAAAAVLVKLPNAAVLSALAAALLVRLRRERRPGKVLAESWLLLASAALPLALWTLRNRLVLDGWTGTGGRLAVRGLHPKPLSEWPEHPLFTAGGPPAFLRALCDSLFRGDANWHGGVAYFEPARVFFLVNAALLPAIGMAAPFWSGQRHPGERLATWMSALVVAATVGELAFLSLLFYFPDVRFPPSRQFPFYAFGRLAGGALVPFLALYAAGAAALLGRWPLLFAGAIAAAVVMMLMAQWSFVGPAVSSPFNWFHIR
jgi:hypothetical protein